MINPESQNIGNPVIKPVIARAGALRFSPVFERMNLAMLRVPPVLSRVMPMIAPRIIRKPMEAMVLPNPSLIVLTIFSGGRVAKARKTETRKSAMKAFSFKLDVRMMMAMMLRITTRDVSKMLIQWVLVSCGFG
jgi:hypothetical protein